MRENHDQDELVTVAALTPAAAAEAVLRVAGAAPRCRVERVAGGYRLTGRTRPRWAGLAGWSSLPVRVTTTAGVGIDVRDGRTVLHLTGVFPAGVRPALRALATDTTGPPTTARPNTDTPGPLTTESPATDTTGPPTTDTTGLPTTGPSTTDTTGPPTTGLPITEPPTIRPPTIDAAGPSATEAAGSPAGQVVPGPRRRYRLDAPPPASQWATPHPDVPESGPPHLNPTRLGGAHADPLDVPGRRGHATNDGWASRNLDRHEATAANTWADNLNRYERDAANAWAAPDPGPPALTGTQQAGPVLVLDTGERLTVGAFDLIGRDPAATAGEDVGQLVKVGDDTRSVSRTHLAVGVDRAGVWVSDRHSTHGSEVRDAAGNFTPCRPGERVRLTPGDVVHFGDRRLRLT